MGPAGITPGFSLFKGQVKHRLLHGLDDIAITLRQDDAIARYEATRPAFKPTVAPAG